MKELTPEQAEAVGRRLSRTVGYLVRLRERMDQVGFVSTDRLYQIVCKAEDAMLHLSVALHYASCKGGVARPPDPTP
jgi:hypothetical protein